MNRASFDNDVNHFGFIGLFVNPFGLGCIQYFSNQFHMDAFRSEFGQRMKLARTRANLTQEDLADGLGVERLAVQRWELGQRVPRIDRLVGWEALTSTSLSWLISGRESGSGGNLIEVSEIRLALDDLSKAREGVTKAEERLRSLLGQ